ncbi:hypothetical protein V6N13_016803 [Hibiscus sabdariffa]
MYLVSFTTAIGVELYPALLKTQPAPARVLASNGRHLVRHSPSGTPSSHLYFAQRNLTQRASYLATKWKANNQECLILNAQMAKVQSTLRISSTHLLPTSGEFTAGCLCSNSARSDVIKGSNQVKVDSFGSGEYLGQNQPCGFKSNSSEL